MYISLAGVVCGIIGGIIGYLFNFFASGQALSWDLFLGTLIFSIIAGICALVVKDNDKVSGIIFLVCAIGLFICSTVYGLLGAVLLAIAGFIALLRDRL